MECCLEYTSIQVNLIEYKYLCCNKIYQKTFANTYKSSNHETKKFILLLWKVIYTYEYMDDWEKFNKPFLWYGWSTKGVKPFPQAGPLLEILTIVNLWHAAGRI